MSVYGIEVYRPGGTILWSSTSTDRMQLMLPAIVLTAGNSATQTYPALAGRAIQAQALSCPGSSSSGGEASEPVVDYTLGYPRVTVPSRTFNQYIVLFLV